MSKFTEIDEPLSTGPTTRALAAITFGILGMLALTVVVVVIMSQAKDDSTTKLRKHAAIGMTFPTVGFDPLTASQPLTTAQMRGKITLINVWGPWCGPCRLELPELEKLTKAFAADDRFQFVSVSLPRDPGDPLKEQTETVLEQLKLDLPTYHDPTNNAMERIYASAPLEPAVPLTLLIGPDLKYKAVWLGYDESYLPEMQTAVKQLLAMK